jgi:hypothetical protein
MILVIATFLLWLWIVASAASRGSGLFVVLPGLLGLALAVAAFRRGRKRPLYALYYACFMGAILALALETTLRLAPGVLSGPVANVAYSGYHWQSGGIYELDDHMGPDMRKAARREMYWSGHWWSHRANSRGFRGPEMARADAVFLGDSMVYGHGVSEADTLAVRFTEHSGLAAANLGQQGTSQVQSWMRLQRIGLPLKPRVVFAASHFTDLADAHQWYAPEELQSYLQSPLETPHMPVARDEYRPRPRWDPVAAWARHVSLPMRCSAIWGAAFRAAVLRGRHQWPQAAGHWTIPAPRDVDAPFDPTSSLQGRVGWDVHVRSVRQIKRLCDGAGARLVLFDVGYPTAFSRAVERLAAEVGADYSPAGRLVLQKAYEGRPVYLPDDGHWTREGNDIVARELTRTLLGAHHLDRVHAHGAHRGQQAAQKRHENRQQGRGQEGGRVGRAHPEE